MSERPTGTAEAMAGAVNLLINREHALERERELEAEIERWRAMYWARNDEFYRLDVKTSQENATLREQNATLRAEIERLTKGGAE